MVSPHILHATPCLKLEGLVDGKQCHVSPAARPEGKEHLTLQCVFTVKAFDALLCLLSPIFDDRRIATKKHHNDRHPAPPTWHTVGKGHVPRDAPFFRMFVKFLNRAIVLGDRLDVPTTRIQSRGDGPDFPGSVRTGIKALVPGQKGQ